MGIGYQASDRGMIDYDLWFLERGIPGLRGPRRYFGESHFMAFTGAAQTFGRFVHNPFPEQLGNLTDKPFINLGISGAGPEYFLARPTLLDLVSRSAVHFSQVLSGRSVTAGVFECNRSNNGVLKFVDGPLQGQEMMADNAYGQLRNVYGVQAYEQQVKAAQDRWVELYREFISTSNTPTYLLWVSEANIGEVGEQLGGDSPVGTFPHFVTREMLARVAELSAGIIDCTFEASHAQALYSDTSGELYEAWDRKKYPNRPDRLRAFNVYYTPPEHHNHVTKVVMKRMIEDDLI